jgi:hypothetical protein
MLKKQDYNGLAQIAINEYGQAPENQGLDRHAWRSQPELRHCSARLKKPPARADTPKTLPSEPHPR